MPKPLAPRLAWYTAITSTATVASGDIQVYEGPPIPLDDQTTSLSLAGLQFELVNSIYTDRESNWWGGGTTCCEYASTTWGYTYCNWYSSSQNFSARSFFQLRVECGFDNLLGVRFRPVGAPVGSPPCQDSSELCFVTFWSNQNCDGGDAGSFGTCDVPGTYHLGFEAFREFPDFETYQGWIRIEGTTNDLRITRWAWEDSGGPINVGEEPPPECPADLDGDDQVDGGDLGLLLANFGRKGVPTGDINGDGRVDGADVGLMLVSWGPCR